MTKELLLEKKEEEVRKLSDEIRDAVDKFESECDTFLLKRVKAAGRRSRKQSLFLEKLLKEWRKKSVELEKLR